MIDVDEKDLLSSIILEELNKTQRFSISEGQLVDANILNRFAIKHPVTVSVALDVPDKATCKVVIGQRPDDMWEVLVDKEPKSAVMLESAINTLKTRCDMEWDNLDFISTYEGDTWKMSLIIGSLMTGVTTTVSTTYYKSIAQVPFADVRTNYTVTPLTRAALIQMESLGYGTPPSPPAP